MTEPAKVTIAKARSTRWTDENRLRERDLLHQMSDLREDSPQYQRARDELVEMHVPLVAHLARRFRDRGEPEDDLIQVGTIGLIKSVDRYDIDRGVELSTYATPTIVGEIKRHFRDRGWSIRVPRRLQEMRQQISIASAELGQRTGRTPTVRELAAFMEVSEDEVLEGLESAQAYSTISLDAQAGGDSDEGEPSALRDTLGVDDYDLVGIEYRETLRPMLDVLPQRERDIILMRFFRNMTQAQIAEEIGISQMQVSRLLARSLTQMRAGAGDEF